MARLSNRLQKMAADGSKALVAYIVAGDPTPEVTVPLMHRMVECGVDVIELGVPFSDPEAEGPVIQLGHERALANGTSLADCIEMVRTFRESDTTTPIVLMGYLNPIEIMGYDRFAKSAGTAGVDGTIIVNLPPEESGTLSLQLAENDIESVYLLAPTTTDERAASVGKASRGFVYYVSLKGTTGAGSLDVADVKEKVARFRQYTTLPIMVGFGIKDGESARAVADASDGAVVGSAIVSLMEQYRDDPVQLNLKVGEFVSELKAAIV